MAETAVSYKFGDVPFTRQTIMAEREEKEAALLSLYPKYEMVKTESVLWNWIEAVAQDNGVDHEVSRRVLADAGDPIFGGKSAEVVGRWVWYLA